MKKQIAFSILIAAPACLFSGPSWAGDKSCTALVVSSDGNPGHGKSQFSVRSDSTLHFHLVVPGNPTIGATDLVTIEVTTPRGHHFQTIDLPVAAAGSKEKQRQVQGYPFPLPVQQFAAASGNGKGAQHVAGTIPLAGGLIENYSMYGKWSAQASLGSGNPCSASFTVEQ